MRRERLDQTVESQGLAKTFHFLNLDGYCNQRPHDQSQHEGSLTRGIANWISGISGKRELCKDWHLHPITSSFRIRRTMLERWANHWQRIKKGMSGTSRHDASSGLTASGAKPGWLQWEKTKSSRKSRLRLVCGYNQPTKVYRSMEGHSIWRSLKWITLGVCRPGFEWNKFPTR